MCRVTPPGYVHEYGATSAMRTTGMVPAYPADVASRHFVKYTFLQVDPAWRRLDADERAEHKREFLAACEDYATDHMLQSFSLVGTRADAELMLVLEAENLDRIHEFDVVLAQSGLMNWATQPYSFLGMRKGSEYSNDERNIPRRF